MGRAALLITDNADGTVTVEGSTEQAFDALLPSHRLARHIGDNLEQILGAAGVKVAPAEDDRQLPLLEVAR